MTDIVILSDHRYLKKIKNDWYINQVVLENTILKNELEKLTLSVEIKDWKDEVYNWKNTKYAIFRNTWDYFEKFEEFNNWIIKTKTKTKFINCIELVKWNTDKKYLKFLSDKGINVSKTEFINKKSSISLSDLFKKTQFNQAIIKPCISGAAKDTYRLNKSNFHRVEKTFNSLLKTKDMIFQEFLSNITIFGEISLIFIGKQFTHAVKKIAKKGDFRVQDDHGGTVEVYYPTKNEIKFGLNCLNKIPHISHYSRVDIIYDNNDKLSLCELELIEPELWFRNNKKAATILAKNISNLINSKPPQI